MKKFLLGVAMFGATFTATYTYLDVTNNQEKDVQAIEQANKETNTNTTRSERTTDDTEQRTSNKGTRETSIQEVGQSMDRKSDNRIKQEIGGRTFELTNPNATMTIQEDGWHMDTQQGNYHVLVNYTDEKGTQPLCTLQINGDGWTLYNQNNVIIDGGSLV